MVTTVTPSESSVVCPYSCPTLLWGHTGRVPPSRHVGRGEGRFCVLTYGHLVRIGVLFSASREEGTGLEISSELVVLLQEFDGVERV